MTLKFVCFIGSVREGRNADRVVKLLKNQFDEVFSSKGYTLEVIDPKEYDLPLLQRPLHFYPDLSKAPEYLHTLNKKVSEADAYFVVTAEYNRTLPPALTNLLDHVPPPSYEFKASGIIGYSMGPGATFAIAAARPFLSEFGCLPVKHFVSISAVNNTVKEDGTTENTHVVSSFKKLFGEVEWWARAAKALRDTEGKPNQKK